MGQVRADRGVAGTDDEVRDPAVLDVSVGVQVPAAEIVGVDLEIRRLRVLLPPAPQAGQGAVTT